MNKALRNPAVKAIMAIVCVLCFAASIVSGLCLTAMLATGEFNSSGSLHDWLLERQLDRDCDKIMFDYFDPAEPTQPWRSYYDGGIYTGEDSNFRYNIVDPETGYSVLSTIEGGEKVRLRWEYDHGFSFGTEVPTVDRYVISDVVFTCGDTTYLYSAESDYFYPVYDENVLSYLSPITIGDDVFQLGFTYAGNTADSIDTTDMGTAESHPLVINEAHYEFDGEGFFLSPASMSYVEEYKSYTIIGYVLYDLAAKDNYYHLYNLTSFLSNHAQELIVFFAVTTILGLLLLILLLCNVGRTANSDQPVVSLLFRLPADLVVVVAVLALVCDVALNIELSYGLFRDTNYLLELIPAGLLLLAGLVVIVYTLCLISVRGKTRTLISGSFLYWCWRNLGRILKKLVQLCGKALGYLPLIWKVATCYMALCFIELLFLLMFGSGELAICWLIEKVLLGTLVGYIALAFRRLKLGAEAIAAGDYTTKIDTDHLAAEFKDTAETLNNIQGGMNAAVESRMRSERLKTELITNVSHDIKTPLTSIVSYVDLLKQEPAGSQAASEYIEVLDRQSARLKKLVEDLVEASKASTGNITVHPEPLDLSVMLGQALGEYNERLLTANLTPVVKVPETPVAVSADGRLLWRIFDNLLGNTVKYAMPGTRFYVTVSADTHAIVTFRNISREPLDVSAEELMERFVRGDASRHTEGSGLGLSIAKSLAESMSGQFLLSVDGDLFKAAVIFPLLPSQE